MCGDVNAFLSEIDDDDDETGERRAGDHDRRARARRRELARTALQMFIAYLLERVPRVGRLVVKVTDANVPSLRLFESLGFTVHRADADLPADRAPTLRRRARARGWGALSREVSCAPPPEGHG